MLFWSITTALTLACSSILALALLRGRIGDAPPAAYDLQVYRDQLKEVDRDLARGVLGEEEAERIRTEVSRRILAADAQLRDGGATGGQPRLGGSVMACLAALCLIAGSFALYVWLGAPGYPDLPQQVRIAASEQARLNRLSQSEIEARLPNDITADRQSDISEEYRELIQQLRNKVRDRPGDARGLALLARNEAALGNFSAAHRAQAQLITARGPAASADDYADLVDMMVSAAAGYVSADAELALRETLRRAPEHPRARYYLGLYLMQVDRPDAAFRTWNELLLQSRADDPWTPLIRSQIEDLAWRAGNARYQLPPENAAPDPTRPALDGDDVAAARQMTPQERAEMIRGMVDGLQNRIATEGGTVEEWARLSNALAVLGDYDRLRELLVRARVRFADDPLDLELVENAAKQAGFSE